jgi:hypothetical protein
MARNREAPSTKRARRHRRQEQIDNKTDDNRRQAEQRIGHDNQCALAPETIYGQCGAKRRTHDKGANACGEAHTERQEDNFTQFGVEVTDQAGRGVKCFRKVIHSVFLPRVRSNHQRVRMSALGISWRDHTNPRCLLNL